MTGESLDRTLETWLRDDAAGRVPDHLDAVLAATTAIRQRHARPAPWATWSGRTRVLAVAAALTLAAAAMTAVAIGRPQPHVEPVPPVQAANGVLLVRIDGDLYALDATGSNQRAIVVGPEGEFGAAFSPDGSRFAYTEMDASFHIRVFVANADGSERTVVYKSGTVGPTGYAWSPDGARLAILHGKGSNGSVLGGTVSIVDVDDPEVARDVPLPDADVSIGHGAFGVQVAWASDGELILVGAQSSDASGERIFGVRPDGSGFREIARPEGHYYVGLSPDGRRLTYFDYIRDRIVVGAQAHLVDVATGEDRVFLSGHGGWDQELLFSPDGKTGAMVACVNSGTVCDLVIVSLDGSTAPRVIGPGGGPTPKERHFVYSPDGRRIALSRNGAATIVIDVATGAQTVLGDGQSSIEAWQPLPLH